MSFCVLFKKYLPNLKSRSFFRRCFISLTLTFMNSIKRQVLLIGIWMSSSSSLFINTVLSPIIYFDTFVYIQWIMYWFCFLICLVLCLNFLLCSVNAYIYSNGNTVLSWFMWLCSKLWSLSSLFFFRLFWLSYASLLSRYILESMNS